MARNPVAANLLIDPEHPVRRPFDTFYSAAFVPARANPLEPRQHPITNAQGLSWSTFGQHDDTRRLAVAVPIDRPGQGVAVFVESVDIDHGDFRQMTGHGHTTPAAALYQSLIGHIPHHGLKRLAPVALDAESTRQVAFAGGAGVVFNIDEEVFAAG